MDRTGERCAIGQSGPVWLSGVDRRRGHAEVHHPGRDGPALPIINFVDVNVTNQTAEELRAEVAPFMDGATNLAVPSTASHWGSSRRTPITSGSFSAVFSVTLHPTISSAPPRRPERTRRRSTTAST